MVDWNTNGINYLCDKLDVLIQLETDDDDEYDEEVFIASQQKISLLIHLTLSSDFLLLSQYSISLGSVILEV